MNDGEFQLDHRQTLGLLELRLRSSKLTGSFMFSELTWDGPDSLQGCELVVGGGGGDQGEADLGGLGPGPELSP